jgi:hypothetical protein
MNIVFWFLVLLSLAGVWFAASPLFKYIGMFFKTIICDTKDEINEPDDNQDEVEGE